MIDPSPHELSTRYLLDWIRCHWWLELCLNWKLSGRGTLSGSATCRQELSSWSHSAFVYEWSKTCMHAGSRSAQHKTGSCGRARTTKSCQIEPLENVNCSGKPWLRGRPGTGSRAAYQTSNCCRWGSNDHLYRDGWRHGYDKLKCHRRLWRHCLILGQSLSCFYLGLSYWLAPQCW